MDSNEKASTEHRDVEPATSQKLEAEQVNALKTIDTVHQDEALKVLSQYAGDQTWTPQEEKKLTRKIDRKLITLLCITYGLQYYDKAMLSQAVSLCVLHRLRMRLKR